MITPRYILLFVEDPALSARFYEFLLDLAPLEQSPTFALFVLEDGYKLGLWSRHSAKPAVSVTGGGMELAFAVDSGEEVDALYRKWSSLGLSFVQTPTELDFGRTFVALDPDDHRLRVFFPR
ncbi:VOC family protein [Pseudomonas sp. N3-W]|jgi:predicted enzyme related to lactoylglutathione lyase|uniref:VOC family protein n=1 Tax=Pseudomonas fungipugnans TaxID=3024217 RepID=A0ABT6QXW0_9PSED|nr:MULTISPECIES: VOC family protein [unclassified Pseudomonas]MDI2595124.1 VOC family protein [Pseudomonas sp. 681]UWF51410.1 VOC family protein [Pseudomonas sp. N3-W]